jgi:hypothetical protein
MIGIPWGPEDIHKGYHVGQPINFCFDTQEMIRTRTMDPAAWFADNFDQWLNNLPWNDRLYCCMHQECGEFFIRPGKDRTDEGPGGSNAEQVQAMIDMQRDWIRYAKSKGVTIMTLPEAVEEYERAARGVTIPSTLLTTDKYHGTITWYTAPYPDGVGFLQPGPAGHYPDTLFHCDQECLLVFVHPELTPRTLLDYTAETVTPINRPYPDEQLKPNITGWHTVREGDTRTYTYNIQSWLALPYGLAEWGDFKGWEVAETNAQSARIIDDRVMLIRMAMQPTSPYVPDECKYWVKLRRAGP